MRCRNCKYWTRRKLYWTKKLVINWQTNEPYVVEGWSEKERTNDNILESKEQDSKFGICSQGCMQYTCAGGYIEDDDLDPDNDSRGLIYSDGEAYGAYLYTGEDFGCIHFMEYLSKEAIEDIQNWSGVNDARIS